MDFVRPQDERAAEANETSEPNSGIKPGPEPKVASTLTILWMVAKSISHHLSDPGRMISL